MLTGINHYRNQRVVRDGVELVALAAGRPDPKARLHLALSMLYWLIGEKAKVGHHSLICRTQKNVVGIFLCYDFYFFDITSV